MAHAEVPTNPETAPEGGFTRFARHMLDVVLPPQCLGCGRVVDEPGVLCPSCWAGLRLLAPPWCISCGLPFEYDPGPEAVCAGCAREQPPFARARAAIGYDDASRGLVLAFKHGDRTEAAPAFARWMVRAGADLLADAEVLVPVPLHWTRLLARRYNQAALLAQALAGLSGRPYVPASLRRRRRTPSQGGLGLSARRENVRGAFVVSPRAIHTISDRRVLLIDDVLTTGATAAACARALLTAGARAVDVLALARVGRPLD